jgi:hypothetical protein
MHDLSRRAGFSGWRWTYSPSALRASWSTRYCPIWLVGGAHPRARLGRCNPRIGGPFAHGGDAPSWALPFAGALTNRMATPPASLR